jgi:hypothetical protein
MIRYLPHAEETLVKRGLRPEWIEDAVERPDWTEIDPFHPDRIRSYKAIPALSGVYCALFTGPKVPISWY